MKRYFIIGLIFSFVVLALVVIFNYRYESIALLPDTGASWYYWKLPERDWVVMLIVWGLYASHQLGAWILLAKQALAPADKKKNYTKWILIYNGMFILIHFLQSQIFYDGLAQDVPVWSSQGSVIVMLVLVLIIENKRRGLFLGLKVPGFDDITKFIRKYHGLFITWAVIYTFWYHPMVSTTAHLVGFLYLFLLMMQMSFGYTKIHTNKYWTFILEVMVLIHGTMVAVYQANNMWPMFAFGFAFIAVFTQIYGVGLSKKWIKIIQILYLVAVIIVFGGFTGHRTIGEIHQITWIPIIEYGLVFVLLFVGNGVLKLKK